MTGMIVAGLPPQPESGAEEERGDGLVRGVGAAGLTVGGIVGERRIDGVGAGDEAGGVEGAAVGTAVTAASLGGVETAMSETAGDEELHPATRATTAKTTTTG